MTCGQETVQITFGKETSRLCALEFPDPQERPHIQRQKLADLNGYTPQKKTVETQKARHRRG